MASVILSLISIPEASSYWCQVLGACPVIVIYHEHNNDTRFHSMLHREQTYIYKQTNKRTYKHIRIHALTQACLEKHWWHHWNRAGMRLADYRALLLAPGCHWLATKRQRPFRSSAYRIPYCSCCLIVSIFAPALFPALALRVQQQSMSISGASNLLKLPLQQKTSFYDYVCFLDDPPSAELGARMLLI